MGLQYCSDREEVVCLRLVQLERFLRIDSENTHLEFGALIELYIFVLRVNKMLHKLVTLFL